MDQNTLYHYGIKGQKWGVRRFQEKDGSLTPAGKKRYDNDGIKSKHRINLEHKYIKQGLSKEEAEKAADKRIKAELFVAGVATVAVVGAIAYKKHLNNGKDFVVSKNTSLQRIMRLDKGSDPYKGAREYVSFTKMDNIKYKGMMGKFEGDTAKAMNKGLDEIHRKNPGIKTYQKYQEMYNVKITPKQDIKVASINRAKNTFVDLYRKDADFKKSYDQWMKTAAENKRTAHGSFIKFAKNISKGDVTDDFLKKTGYKAFNVSIAERDELSLKIQNKFYDALKAQGKHAIVDLNDKQGLLKSSKPLITFDGSYDYSKTVLSNNEIKTSLTKAVPVILAQNLAKPAAMALVAAYANNRISANKRNDEIIRNYKKEHPNTTKTDKEILEMNKH